MAGGDGETRDVGHDHCVLKAPANASVIPFSTAGNAPSMPPSSTTTNRQSRGRVRPSVQGVPLVVAAREATTEECLAEAPR